MKSLLFILIMITHFAAFANDEEESESVIKSYVTIHSCVGELYGKETFVPLVGKNKENLILKLKRNIIREFGKRSISPAVQMDKVRVYCLSQTYYE